MDNIYLANLKEKTAPNIKQKQGISVYFTKTELVSPDKDESLIEHDEEGNIVVDYREDVDYKKIKQKTVACKIIDGRKASNINREILLKKLQEKKLLPITKKAESQTKMAETVILEDDEGPGIELQQSDDVLQKSEEDEVDEEEEEEDAGEEDAVEEDAGEEDAGEDKQPKKVIIKRKKKVDETHEQRIINDVNPNEILNGVTIKKRLPNSYQHRLKTSAFYMNNRKKFISELGPMFEDYKKELEEEAGGKPKSKPSGFSPMIHQKVVSDYLNLYTPYRGLLLFHGLGSGKTCSSIAIAEGMKSQKQIFVLTLASLKANFFSQMKECGDPIYRLDQYWEFISIEGKPDYVSLLSKILSIPESSIKTRKGAWMVNITKKTNFDDLSDDDKKVLNNQIDEMIRSKYTDVNYNGLLDSNIDSVLKMPPGSFKKGKINPFDNSVIIIDEVHNFVSMIVNKIRVKDKKSNAYRLYEYLMSATNARIVLLSGTPIINYPNEIGVLFNILRGYIKTWTFPIKMLQGGETPTRDKVTLWLEQEGLKQFDEIIVKPEFITITRNPFGFINTNLKQGQRKGGGKEKKTKRVKSVSNRKTKKKQPEIVEMSNGLIKVNDPDNSVWDQSNEKRKEEIDAKLGTQHGGGFASYSGVVLDETGNLSDTDFKTLIVKALNKHSLSTPPQSKIKVTNNIALPDNSAEFFDLFVELDSSEMKNKSVFQKRVLGLTSYFKGASEDLYPSYVPSDEDIIYHIERIPMSSYQFGIYEKIREEESKQEKRNKQKQAKQTANELFNTSSTYKIASRLCCNFSFPDPPGRPGKKSTDFVDKDDMNEIDREEFDQDKKKRGGGDSDSEEEMDMRDIEEQIDEDEEEEKEKKPPRKLRVMGDIVLKDIEMIQEPEKAAPIPKKVKAVEVQDSSDSSSDEDEIKVKKPKKLSNAARDKDFSRQITEVLYEMNARKEEIFSEDGLRMYSPKFLKILQNIQNSENTGLHLIYSQFRTLEGIALIKYMLDANGYAQFKIRKASGGDWEVVESEEDKGKPKYALHTGTESEEEKRVLLNIYNSKWSEAPSTIVNKLEEDKIENNFMGDAIKILMITSSGAEGINLKNTRFVHIVEPYWNMVRLEQVIGRARRIASHMDLPEQLRNVKVYLYMSTIPEEAITSDKHKSLRNRDISRLSNKLAKTIDESTFLGRYVRHLSSMPTVISTDQLLFERALQKNQVNSQILTAVKESAMDCSLYENKGEDLACYKLGQHITTNTFESHPTIQEDVDDKDVIDTRKKRTSYEVYNYKGRKLVIDRNTFKLYTFEDYQKEVKDKVLMKPIGQVIKKKYEETVQLY